MMTPILDLVVHHLKHSASFPQLHWGSQNVSVSTQDTVAEVMADWIVRLNTLYKVERVNTLDMTLYGTNSRYLKDHPTLREFIETCDAPIFTSFCASMYKV